MEVMAPIQRLFKHTNACQHTHLFPLMFGGIILSIIMLFCLFSICLSICPSIHPFLHCFIILSCILSFVLSLILSIHPSIHPSVRPSSFQSCWTFYLCNTATCKRRYFEKMYLFFSYEYQWALMLVGSQRSSNYLLFCSTKKSTTGLGQLWGWENYGRICNFEWNIPLSLTFWCRHSMVSRTQKMRGWENDQSICLRR